MRTGRTFLHPIHAAADNPQHLQNTFSDRTIPGANRQKDVYEVAPSGN